MTSEITNFQNRVTPITTKISSGQTTSEAVNLYSTTLKTIYLPSTFTGTSLTFKVSYDGVNYFDYCNIDNNLVTITCTQNRTYGLAAIDFNGISWLKIVSNATEAADRTITLVPQNI